MTPQESDLVLCIVGGCLCLGGLLLAGIDWLDHRFPEFFDRIDTFFLGGQAEGDHEEARS